MGEINDRAKHIIKGNSINANYRSRFLLDKQMQCVNTLGKKRYNRDFCRLSCSLFLETQSLYSHQI